ncbi:MAG: hypothetical protein RI897_4400 [Verrucomicrobiota bacterium]
MPRWNGGIIGVANEPNSSVAMGIWSLSEQERYQLDGLWPEVLVAFSVDYLIISGGGGGGSTRGGGGGAG